jgi:hypothetical protein
LFRETRIVSSIDFEHHEPASLPASSSLQKVPILMNPDPQHRILTSEIARHLRLWRNRPHLQLATHAEFLANDAKPISNSLQDSWHIPQEIWRTLRVTKAYLERNNEVCRPSSEMSSGCAKCFVLCEVRMACSMPDRIKVPRRFW